MTNAQPCSSQDPSQSHKLQNSSNNTQLLAFTNTCTRGHQGLRGFHLMILCCLMQV